MRGDQGGDPLDVGDEAHVEHAVSLVDDEDARVVEQKAAALEQVEQSARRGDEHIDAAGERFLLVGHALAADQKRVVQLQVAPVIHEVLGDLKCQFARGFQDQAARHAGAGAGSRQNVKQRERETCRFAGAGLGDPEHISAHQDVGYRLFLNRRWIEVALILDGADDFFRKSKVREAHSRRLQVVGLLVNPLVTIKSSRIVAWHRRGLRGFRQCQFGCDDIPGGGTGDVNGVVGLRFVRG